MSEHDLEFSDTKVCMNLPDNDQPPIKRHEHIRRRQVMDFIRHFLFIVLTFKLYHISIYFMYVKQAYVYMDHLRDITTVFRAADCISH